MLSLMTDPVRVFQNSSLPNLTAVLPLKRIVLRIFAIIIPGIGNATFTVNVDC